MIKMKRAKTKIMSIAALSTIILLLSVNTSLAAVSPSWLGVNEGELHVWGVNLHGSGMLAIAEDMPDNNLPLNGSSWLSQLTFGVNLNATITAVSPDQTMTVLNYTNVQHRILSVSASYTIPGLNIESDDPVDVDVPILNPTQEGFHFLMGVMISQSMNKMFGGNETEGALSDENMFISLLIIPKENITWSLIASMANMYLDKVNDTMSATALSNGMTINIPAYAANNTNKEIIVVSATYGGNGLLQTASLTYGGLSVITITYGGTNIPGFEIVIVIGMSGVAAIGLIYTVKRKRKTFAL